MPKKNERRLLLNAAVFLFFLGEKTPLSILSILPIFFKLSRASTLTKLLQNKKAILPPLKTFCFTEKV